MFCLKPPHTDCKICLTNVQLFDTTYYTILCVNKPFSNHSVDGKFESNVNPSWPIL